MSCCVEQPGRNDASGNRTKGPYACVTDADCVVKDVHNCCGYFPRCVNRDYVPDIEAVRRECAQEGMGSVCGYSEIDSCRCIDGECKSMQGGSVV